jgi:peptidoglycan/xylan/chitin deacetylase (PgdA/CDA1 family)
MIRIALTHDVDRVKKSYQYFTHSLKYLLKGDISNMVYHIKSYFGDEPYWNFPEIIKIEEKYNVRSTFFFMHESMKFNLFDKSNWQLSLGRYSLYNSKIIKIIKFLDSNGWEIGLHGSFNSFNDLKLLSNEKIILENILGHEVQGVRQHYLNLNDKTWKFQKTCGFKYDSTFGYTRKIGFKDDQYLSFHPFNDDFTVIPLVVMDSCFMSTENNWNEYLNLLDKVEETNGILVINWHQRDFNDKEFPNHKQIYIQMIEEGLKRGANFKCLNDCFEDILNSRNLVNQNNIFPKL